MKGSASINWKSGQRVGSLAVEAKGSTMMDTLDSLKSAILDRIDAAPDHIAFGWTNVSISIVRGEQS